LFAKLKVPVERLLEVLADTTGPVLGLVLSPYVVRTHLPHTVIGLHNPPIGVLQIPSILDSLRTRIQNVKGAKRDFFTPFSLLNGQQTCLKAISNFVEFSWSYAVFVCFQKFTNFKKSAF
jgi:hypothetical protein